MNARFRISSWLLWSLAVGVLPAATLLAQGGKAFPRRPGDLASTVVQGEATLRPALTFADVKYGPHGEST